MTFVVNSKKKVYSFDLFDTLICRAVQNPRVVFGLMEQHCQIKYKNIIFQTIGFRKLRILAEMQARKKSDAEDIGLDEIYHQEVAKFVDNWQELKQKELELELAVIYPIQDNLNLLRDLQQQGKNCCITSDMYLPMEFMERLIEEKLGLSGIKIFLSSQIKKTKHSGNLYHEVKSFYNCEFSDIFHVGDNEYSDIKKANELGIETLCVKNHNTNYKGDNLFLSLATPYQNTRNVFYDLGFVISGPVAWATASWIKNDLQKKGIEKIFWGARDGYLFDKIFQQISNIKSVYFRVSRRALFLPTFALDDQHLDLLFEGDNLLSAKDFFARLGFDCSDELVNLKPIEHQEKFTKALQKLGFAEQCNNEYQNFIRYIEKLDFLGRAAFFDLGWRGSLQRTLKNLLKDKTEIEGYYFGLTAKKKGTPSHNAYYFYEDTHFNRFKALNQSLAFFEFLFTEPVQSLKCIKWQGDEIVYENIDNQERQELLGYRKDIMQGAEDFFEVILKLSKVLNFDVQKIEKDLESVVQNAVNNPSDEVIRAFGDIEHSATFGGTFTKNIVELGEYDVNAYRWSFWRSAYIKQAYGKNLWLGKIIHFVLYTDFLNGLIFYKKLLADFRKKSKK